MKFEGVEFLEDVPVDSGTTEIKELSEIVKYAEGKNLRYVRIPREYKEFNKILQKIPIKEYNGNSYYSYSSVVLPDRWILSGKRKKRKGLTALILKKE